MNIGRLKNRIYTDANIQTINPLDLHREFKSKNLVKSNSGIQIASNLNEELRNGMTLDITTWLKQASIPYEISPDINDYILVPCVTIPADFPNRNGVGFPLENLLKFMPEMGMISYKTFKGQPTFYEHQNKDIKKAKGVIADSQIKKLKGYGGGSAWKLVKLLCFDRTKDPELTKRILTKDINSYSMGAYATDSYCSYCEAPIGKCSHIDRLSNVSFYELNGHVVHKVMDGIKGFETSAVESPAWMTAISDKVIMVGDK